MADKNTPMTPGMQAACFVTCIVAVGGIFGLGALGASASSSKPEKESFPVAEPTPTIEPCFHDEDRTRPAMADWLNAHAIETWPTYNSGAFVNPVPDTNWASEQIITEVLVPLGCDPESLLTMSEASDGTWDAWYAWVEAQPAKVYESRPDGDSPGRCRMSFGTGGFHWSCSVSTP